MVSTDEAHLTLKGEKEMTTNELLRNYSSSIMFFVDEMTDEEIEQLWKDCESAGLKFQCSKIITQFGNEYLVHEFEAD